jgi:phthiodiolone/phenolphthiodiolone dimycocerosates ketoreductase
MRGLRFNLFLARLLRLDTFFVWDHLQNIFPSALWDRQFTWAAGLRPSPHECYDFQTILGALAGQAGNVRLGVGVTEPIRRHPVVIAQAMVTLAHLTRRPPILGIGAGERENIEPYGLDFTHPVDRLEEALQVIRLCLAATGPIDFAGTHFHLDKAVFDLAAPPGRTPRIWVGGAGPRMLRLTGQYGDGWYPVGLFSPEEYAARLAVIHAAARAAGRDPHAITPSLQAYILVAPSEGEARAMMETPVIRFLGLLLPAERWRSLSLAHPFGEGFRGYVDFLPEHYARQELRAAMARVPPELADVGVISGTPAQVVARLRTYGEAGMRHVVPQLVSAAVSRRAALYSLHALRLIARSLATGD